MTNFNILQEIKTKKIDKISEIEKIIKCPCGKGEMKLRSIYVNPNDGRAFLRYGNCSYSFCQECPTGIYKFTNIIIPELVLGE